MYSVKSERAVSNYFAIKLWLGYSFKFLQIFFTFIQFFGIVGFILILSQFRNGAMSSFLFGISGKLFVRILSSSRCYSKL